MNPNTVTGKINIMALQLLDEHPEGIQWSELIKMIRKTDPLLHPKTVNGCIWKLVQNFPEKVYKTSRGLFRLLKYKEE